MTQLPLLIFLIGSVTRSLIIGQLAYDYSLADDPELLYRGIAGGLLGTISLSIFSIFAAITKEHAETERHRKRDQRERETAADARHACSVSPAARPCSRRRGR